MPLLIDDSQTFDVETRYTENGSEITFYDKDKAPDGHSVEKFTFKRPSWRDVQLMMSASMVPSGGTLVLNPYMFMDAKIKLLLKRWTLKDSNGPVPVTEKNIEMLHPAMAEHLNTQIDVAMTPVPKVDAKSQEIEPKA